MEELFKFSQNLFETSVEPFFKIMAIIILILLINIYIYIYDRFVQRLNHSPFLIFIAFILSK